MLRRCVALLILFLAHGWANPIASRLIAAATCLILALRMALSGCLLLGLARCIAAGSLAAGITRRLLRQGRFLDSDTPEVERNQPGIGL